MTITRTRKITRQFAHNFVATMRPEEAAEYKSVVDDAIEWAKVNEPGLFYGIVHDYLNFLDMNTEHHICSTCKHWDPFTERAAVPTAHTARTLLTGITPAITGKRGLTNNGSYLQCPISCCDVYKRKQQEKL